MRGVAQLLPVEMEELSDGAKYMQSDIVKTPYDVEMTSSNVIVQNVLSNVNSTENKFCGGCGVSLNAGNKFCTNCGAQIN